MSLALEEVKIHPAQLIYAITLFITSSSKSFFRRVSLRILVPAESDTNKRP